MYTPWNCGEIAQRLHLETLGVSISTSSQALVTFCILLLCFLISPSKVFGSSTDLEPGEYVTQGGVGTLSISQNDEKKVFFSIHAAGTNGHTCSDLDGEIVKGRAVLKPYPQFEPCTMLFERTTNGIKVGPQLDPPCRAFCGARAGYNDEYFKVREGCDSYSVLRSRGEFKDLYDQKEFHRAEAILSKIVKNCEKVIPWIDLGWIKNDLAITQYHLRRKNDCLKTLEPLAEDASLSDEEIKGKFAPVDADTYADSYIAVVQAARTNLKLCRQSTKR